MNVFLNSESEVRSYCRRFSKVFVRADGSCIYDDKDNRYIDFLCGAGALNYGHNNKKIKKPVMEYLNKDGILMSLDLHTQAKKEFIETFIDLILKPRKLYYKLQFTSPTGTSVVESAIKLARKYTSRQNVIAFTNAFHGMSSTSLSLTGSKHHRQQASNGHVTRLPYEGYLGTEVNTLEYLRKVLDDGSSGVDLPAAVILETVQGEGGINLASKQWLRDLRALTHEFGILLIVDDIQAGCGRTGKFFSFEDADIKPDMVCLSKSIGGIGFPFAILLMEPEIDVWNSGEDNGTFRGNNLAFVAARAMLENYWKDNHFEKDIKEKSDLIESFFRKIKSKHSWAIKGGRGRGLMQGLEFFQEEHTSAVVQECFKNNLIIETCGPKDQVLKFMPALTIDLETLIEGIKVVEKTIESVLERSVGNVVVDLAD